MENKQLRYISTELSVEETENEPKVIRGKAIVYNAWSGVLWDEERKVFFREMIKPGAAAGLLGGDIIMSRDHIDDKIIARSTAGNLSFNDTLEYLEVMAKCPDTTLAEDTIKDIRCKNLNGMSFEFTVKPQDEKWVINQGGISTREISKFSRVFAVNPVVYPAYTQTSVEARANEYIEESKLPQITTEEQIFNIKLSLR